MLLEKHVNTKYPFEKAQTVNYFLNANNKRNGPDRAHHLVRKWLLKIILNCEKIDIQNLSFTV